MSAFVAIKTTLSAAASKRSTLFARTKKVFSRSRRAARSSPAVDVCAAPQSPSVIKAVVDEAPSAIIETTLESTFDMAEATSNVVETTPTANEVTPNAIEAPVLIFTPLSEGDAEWTWPHAEYEGVTAEDTLEDELPSHDTLLSLSFSWPLVPGIPRTSPYDQVSLVRAVSCETLTAVQATENIPEVIVTSATASTVEAEADLVHSQNVQTASTVVDELNGPATVSTTTSLELATMDSVTDEDANEVTLPLRESNSSLVHTYAHGAGLFTIIEADEPLESSVVQNDSPSTLYLLPSPFSRGNLCIKEMDALTSLGPETESSLMTCSFSASADLFRGLLAIHASLPSVPAFHSLDSLETIPDESEETLVQPSSSSASVMYAKLKQAVSSGDVDALLRSLVVEDDDASVVF